MSGKKKDSIVKDSVETLSGPATPESKVDILLTRINALEAQLKDFKELIQDIADSSKKNLQEAKYERETNSTNIAQFRDELENFQQSGHPSFTSTLDKLTNFLLQHSAASEAVTNKPPILSDPSCPSFITFYISYLKYQEKNGFLTFTQLFNKNPSIVKIFLERIRFKDKLYTFPLHLSDIELFREILSKVFYPYGFPVEAFQLLISANPMQSPITVQSAYSYALFIKGITDALETILPQTEPLILKCWEIVRQGIDQRHELSYKLSSEHPLTYTRFYYSLDKKIKNYFESSPPPLSSTTPPYCPSHPRSNAHTTYQYRPSGNYSGNTGPSPLSSPSPPPIHQRTIANVSATSASCENCGVSGHTSIECEREFCRVCQQQDDSSFSFFHRPRNCVLFDFHDREV